MRRGPIIVLALIVFLTSYGVTSSAPVGKTPAKELMLGQIEILYTTGKDIHFPMITAKYAVWLEGSLFGGADVKSMNLETKEVFKLNETSLERAFFFAPGVGTSIVDEYALMLDEEGKTLNLISLDGKEKMVIGQGDMFDPRISSKGRKFFFHQTFNEDASKTGLYSYDIDEAKKPEDTEGKIPQPQFLLATKNPLRLSGDYFIEEISFEQGIDVYNDKLELVKTVEDYDLMRIVGNYLVMTKHDKDYKNMSWHCYDIKKDKFMAFQWPNFGQYIGNCAQHPESRMCAANISSNSNRNLTFTMAYFPEKNKPFTLIEQSTKTSQRNNWKATWDTLAVYPDNTGKYSKLMIFDATNQKKYIASDPTSGAIYPYIGGNSTFVWVQKSGLWGSDLCARKITMPDKK